MKGKILEDFAVLNATTELERAGFGRKKGNKIYLHPVEALYLQMNEKINFGELKNLIEWVKKKVEKFPEIYFVYEDLRKRGRKPRIEGDFVFAKKIFLPFSEMDIISFENIKENISRFGEVVVAIVDEESEVTYYVARELEAEGEQEESLPKLRGTLFKDRVITENIEIFQKYFYGSEIGRFVALSLIESIYLLEKGFLEVENADKLAEVVKSIEGFEEKLKVYKDLKNRKFVVKTGFKFGSDFRVYRRVESIQQLPHSEFLVSVVKDSIKAKELANKVRLANSVRKKPVLVWDGNYFIFEWMKV
ncbi:MAG: tRNA-intron lyase [Archaeoglobaceae archaeon]